MNWIEWDLGRTANSGALYLAKLTIISVGQLGSVVDTSTVRWVVVTELGISIWKISCGYNLVGYSHMENFPGISACGTSSRTKPCVVTR